ncbi:uncharacterized protein LOC126355269 [Schistocerca gregaria]|uniref:uncharacterized protein LOC126355269 n=1 Tax=Schistocerca gregaria TaxID=7010 RepID=UPI00211EEF60|nr:uncharacterized protein LOC126355269 [Schistocerca gregaria]
MQHATIQTLQFLLDKLQLWFAMIELTFAQSKIHDEQTKFAITVNVLDARAATTAEDVILRPPTERPYMALKNVLLTRMRKPLNQQMWQVLKEESIGDRTLSEFWKHLCGIINAGESSDAMPKHIWLNQLSSMVKAALVTCEKDNMQNLLEIADKVHVTIDNPQMACTAIFNGEEASEVIAAIQKTQHMDINKLLQELP